MSPAKKEFIIISVVCNEYKVRVEDIVSPNPLKRSTKFIEPKMVAMYLLRKNTFYTMVHIYRLFGYKQTTNPAWTNEWVETRLLNSNLFKFRFGKIEAILPQIFNIHK